MRIDVILCLLAVAAAGSPACGEPAAHPGGAADAAVAAAAPGEMRVSTVPAGPTATAWLSGRASGRVLRGGVGVGGALVWAESGPHRSLLWQVDPACRPEIAVSAEGLAPPVLGLMAGETLRLRSGDGAAHVVTCGGESVGRMALEVPAGGEVQHTFRATDPGLALMLASDASVEGRVVVFDHPYFATTDATGAFAIHDLPPGDYTLVASHETLGRTELAVAVGADRSRPVVLRLPEASAASPPR